MAWEVRLTSSSVRGGCSPDLPVGREAFALPLAGPVPLMPLVLRPIFTMMSARFRVR
jgi:hypothetical protein